MNDRGFRGGPPKVVARLSRFTALAHLAHLAHRAHLARLTRSAAAVAFAVAALGAAPALLRAQDLGIGVGAQAPRSLPVETLDGGKADLGQYVGKGPVFIQFWAAWCSNCHELEPKVAAARRKYGSKIRFVGVAVSVNQSPTLARRYSEKHHTPLELFYDRSGDAAEAFDAPGTSYVVVLDRTGKVVYTGMGGDQDVDAAVRKAL